MLPAGEQVPENGEILTSSSQVPDPPSPKADRNNNRESIDVLETEPPCDESLSEIIKEDEEESVSSDSLNERKRSRTDEEEEEGNATEAISDANKLRRIHEEEGKNELDEQNGNQDSEHRGNQESEVADEKERGNQENNNGEEDKNEETEEVEKEELPQCSTAEEEGQKHELEEHRENAGEEDNVNRINSEKNERGVEESQQNKGKEVRKASVKGKRPFLEAIVPNFSKFERGEPSCTQNLLPNDDTALIDHELNNDDNYDYHRDLAILRSMWQFKCNNGDLPYAHSDELHNYIMDSIPNLKILGNDLTEKIGELEENFYTARMLDGDNPEMPEPIEREIFDFSMRLWGNSEDNIEELMILI